MANEQIIDNESLDEFILNWNRRHPFDRYIRKKYGISFGSKRHLELNPVDMMIEYREDVLMKRINEEKQDDFEDKKEKVLDGIAKIIEADFKNENQDQKPIKLGNKEIIDDYENLDITKF